jgi:hypothetical protein
VGFVGEHSGLGKPQMGLRGWRHGADGVVNCCLPYLLPPCRIEIIGMRSSKEPCQFPDSLNQDCPLLEEGRAGNTWIHPVAGVAELSRGSGLLLLEAPLQSSPAPPSLREALPAQDVAGDSIVTGLVQWEWGPVLPAFHRCCEIPDEEREDYETPSLGSPSLKGAAQVLWGEPLGLPDLLQMVTAEHV